MIDGAADIGNASDKANTAQATSVLHLFDGYGIELEYMIVDKKTLAVSPIADKLIFEASGSYSGDVLRPRVSWSNELVMHVIELKCSGPDPDLAGLSPAFHDEIQAVNKMLAKWDAMLLPTAMHPFMNPQSEAKLWPHDNRDVYNAYNRIFNCQGHGWSNLQSMHINLPFYGDNEFGRLHAAIRLVLPILPALAASSPIVEGQYSPCADARLDFYRANQRRIPAIAGLVIPEQVFTLEDYNEKIFAKIYQEIAPHDSDGILQHEWLNSRGAIARFDRNAIEIRLIDVQECPRMDLAIAALCSATIRAFVEELDVSFADQKRWACEPLAAILHQNIQAADDAIIENRNYLRLLGIRDESASARTIIARMVETALSQGDAAVAHFEKELRVLVDHGTLSRRLRKSCGDDPSKERIHQVYRELAQCLNENRPFTGA